MKRRLGVLVIFFLVIVIIITSIEILVHGDGNTVYKELLHMLYHSLSKTPSLLSGSLLVPI